MGRLQELASVFPPRCIIAGYIAYSRLLDYKRFREVGIVIYCKGGGLGWVQPLGIWTELAGVFRPRCIIAGYSTYSRLLDYKRFRQVGMFILKYKGGGLGWVYPLREGGMGRLQELLVPVFRLRCIIAGYSAYSRLLDYKRFREVGMLILKYKGGGLGWV